MISQHPLPDTSSQRPPLESLCATVLDGLHAAAQPLTILRAGLEDSNLEVMSVSELRELIGSSAVEVERLCSLFHRLQDLVFTESIKPELSATSILPLLASAADRDIQLFEANRIALRSILPDSCPPVLINSARTLQALSQTLLIAHSFSQPGQTVEIAAHCEPSHRVRVLVRNLDAYVGTAKAETRLSMALAASIMRSQRATMTWSLEPLTAIIEFQEASAEVQG